LTAHARSHTPAQRRAASITSFGATYDADDVCRQRPLATVTAVGLISIGLDGVVGGAGVAQG
jgi:hypothetical protein